MLFRALFVYSKQYPQTGTKYFLYAVSVTNEKRNLELTSLHFYNSSNTVSIFCNYFILISIVNNNAESVQQRVQPDDCFFFLRITRNLLTRCYCVERSLLFHEYCDFNVRFKYNKYIMCVVFTKLDYLR